MKRVALLAFSRRGREKAKETAERLRADGWECRVCVSEKYAENGLEVVSGGISAFTGRLVGRMDAIIFVCACGIAVRAIAPFVKNKTLDPAVICVDERGSYAISLLSGHIGGGNALTTRVAELIGAKPVITTATDINGLFSVDAWAAGQGWRIGSMTAAKTFSAEILERDLPFCADAPVCGELPAGLIRGDTGDTGLCISPRLKKPFDNTLNVLPAVLVLGIGCRRGVSARQIAVAALEVLKENGLDFRAVCEASSVTLKSDEPGLLEFARVWKLKTSFHTPEQLSAQPGVFTPSDFVLHTVGVDNVCERSAAFGGRKLIVGKTARYGVTVAVAEKPWEVRFG